MRMQFSFFAVATVASVALWSGEAKAESDTDIFNPSTEFRPEEFPVSTGFIPGSGPISVALNLTPYQEVSILMFGDSTYDFDATTISFRGEEDSGVFTNTLGADVTVTVQIGLGLNTEFEIGVYSIDEQATAEFTPYVLPGSSPRPIEVAEVIGPFNLVSEDFTVPGFGNPGNIAIDFQINVPGISYQSTDIAITDDPDSAVPVELGAYVTENSNLELTLPNTAPGDTASVWGQLNGTFNSEISFDFNVTVTVMIGDNPITVGPFTIPVAYPLQEDVPIAFPPEELQFDVPEEPAGTSTGDEPEGTSTGDETTGGGGTTSTSTSGGSTGEPDTDSGGLPGENMASSDDGCGCTTSQPNRPVLGLALLLLAWGLGRRRSGTV